MASLSTRKNGCRFIQFTDAENSRKTINLGRMNKRQAETIKGKVERLIVAQSAQIAIDLETANWIGSLTGELRDRIAKAGLIEERKVYTLRGFIDDYLARRTDLKPETLGHLVRCGDRLCESFGDDRKLDTITTAEAVDHSRWLANQGLAQNSVRRECGRAKQMFSDAVERLLINSNPFKTKAIITNVAPKTDRLFFVDRETTYKLLESLPTLEWKAIVALARFGGLRCSSEVIPLKWEDIDHESGRFLIHSPKTEHHPNGATRLCPLFPELREVLDEYQKECGRTEGPVVTRYQSIKQNLGPTLTRFIRNAGIEPWPKPFQNLRSSRETELVQAGHPLHAVCKWIGNSELVATKFYLQVTNDDFERAATEPTGAAYALQSLHDRRGQQESCHTTKPLKNKHFRDQSGQKSYPARI